mgnify:FL=1
MASRVFRNVQALNPELKIVTGSFTTNGSSSPDSDNNTGKGWSVARSGTGEFTVTLEDTYPALLSGNCSLGLNAAGDSKVQFGAIDVVTAKTIVIRTITGTAAADIAANDNNRVHFTLCLRNTDIV